MVRSTTHVKTSHHVWIFSLLFAISLAILAVKIISPQKEEFLKRFKLSGIFICAVVISIAYVVLALQIGLTAFDIVFLQNTDGPLIKLGMVSWFLWGVWLLLRVRIFEKKK